jgi:hypothetical protein
VHAAKLDENVPVEAVELLRAAGWQCDTVHDEGLAGAEDPKVAAACQAGARVLFTLDLDFADIRAYPPRDYVGIVAMRLSASPAGPQIRATPPSSLTLTTGNRSSSLSTRISENSSS